MITPEHTQKKGFRRAVPHHRHRENPEERLVVGDIRWKDRAGGLGAAEPTGSRLSDRAWPRRTAPGSHHYFNFPILPSGPGNRCWHRQAYAIDAVVCKPLNFLLWSKIFIRADCQKNTGVFTTAANKSMGTGGCMVGWGSGPLVNINSPPNRPAAP